MRYAKITGTGCYVPEKILTNADLSQILGEDVNDFVTNILGIRERHICAPDESTADLATRAAESALASAGVSPAEIDLIIVATDTPEYLSPATSVVVQHRLGAKNAGTFDLNAACAGFVTALDTAAKYLTADENYQNILVVGAYAMTKYLDWTEKKTATIFADGAGAVVLSASATPGLLAAKLVADGSFHDFLGLYAGGTKFPVTEEILREGYLNKVRFAKRYPPEINNEGWPRIVCEVLQQANLTTDDVALFLFTQVNLSSIKTAMANLNVPLSRTHTIMGKWGYTGSACIPMALHDAVQAGKLKAGDNVILCASGGGLNMACAVMRW